VSNAESGNKKHYIELMVEDMERHFPKTGFNLVGIDDFNEPGEQLYLIAHFDTYEEALKAQKKYGEEYTTIYRPVKKSSDVT
jgi:hypothetical protein